MGARIAEIEASRAHRSRAEQHSEELELAALKYKMKAMQTYAPLNYFDPTFLMPDLVVFT
eukprot:875557-Pleurochrysis_carterae.AAC.1